MRKNQQQQQQQQKQQRQCQRQQQQQQMQQQMQSNGTKFLSLFIVVIVFTLSFVLLIHKQQNNTYYASLSEERISVKPVVGEIIVAKDMNAIYPKYYVVYLNDESYSIYVYNYYETISQYNLEFNRLIDNIVDYNSKDKMIRYIHSRGYGTYTEVLSNLSVLVDSNNLKIY